MIQPFYSFDAIADVYPYVVPDGTFILVNGRVSRGDRQPLIYTYSSSSTAADDGDNVIMPTSIPSGNPGRYLKTPFDYNALLNRPALSAVATSGSYSDLSNTPATPSVSTPSRTLNGAAYQVSSTRNAMAMYSIQISATISLTTGQTGTVLLQTSPTSGGTYTTVATLTNGNTGTLTIGLNITQTQSAVLSAFIPAGYFVKLVSSGAATNTIINQQEVLL